MQSQAVGKIGEMAFAMALVRRGFNVFSPIVDAGIDLVAERVTGSQPPFQAKYLGFQVKTSRYQPKSDWWYWTVTRYNYRLGADNFYALVLEDEEKLPPEVPEAKDDVCVLIVPSKEIWEHAEQSSKSWQRGDDYAISVEPHYFLNRDKYTWSKFLNAWNHLGR